MKDNLERLIALVEAKITAAGDVRSMDHREARRVGEAILNSLVEEEGAVFGPNGDGYRLLLARVRSTCTSGYFGLLSNWKKAARRKIEGSAAPRAAAGTNRDRDMLGVRI